MDKIFSEQFGHPRGTIWSRVKEKAKSLAPPKPDLQAAVEALYRPHHGNVTAIERALRAQGIRVSRRTVAKILDPPELPRHKRRG